MLRNNKLVELSERWLMEKWQAMKKELGID